MNKKHVFRIAEEFNIEEWKITATSVLLEEGGSVPFIARYRKEATGSLDEVMIADIRDRLVQLEELDKRREAILKSLEEQGKRTEELEDKINSAETLAVLEDIYLPYRPKRRTLATIAREKGLEPLAEIIFSQPEDVDPARFAENFIDNEKGVESIDEALTGARNIMAEWINEDQEARNIMRHCFSEKGSFRTKIIQDKENEGIKYKDYFEWEEPVKSAPSHRVLAMRRGEKEGFLNLTVLPPEEEAVKLLENRYIKNSSFCSEHVRMAVNDSYKRLLSHSMETEIRVETKISADRAAIAIFAQNLHQLLLSPPLGQKRVMAIDPGFRTGCKVVCLDQQGKLLHTDTVFPHSSEQARAASREKIKDLSKQYNIESIAIGNGTAGRETESFIKGCDLPSGVQVIMVNESGASIYSASEVAREEFPDRDLTVRGAVSIGRRLMDPLAELVKIDPKSIGVGQYQHDVDQKALKDSLDDVVMSCVNAVGVEVNTASRQLLAYVSGLGPALAKNIVEFREKHGPFTSREALKEVSRLGLKAFEQAAGFLRIRGGANPLDESAVHPESYSVVEAMARDLNCSVEELIRDKSLQQKIIKENYVTEKIGIPTLDDILQELSKPGRDPRETFEGVSFTEGVEKPEDLRPGMQLPGIITNITAFGAFVDIGVHQDGLVHLSQLADRFVKDPNDIVSVNQKVMVKVVEVDLERKRISLSMRSSPETITKKTVIAKKDLNKNKSQKGQGKKEDRLFNNPFLKALEKGKF